MFLDFGPIFERVGGRLRPARYVLGDDPVKHRLRDALPACSPRAGDYFDAHPDITGAQLYAHVAALAEARAGRSAARTPATWWGEFPHELIDGRAHRVLHRAGQRRARCAAPTAAAGSCHWILEVHLVDREREIGGFFEQLLTVRRPGAQPRPSLSVNRILALDRIAGVADLVGTAEPREASGVIVRGGQLLVVSDNTGKIAILDPGLARPGSRGSPPRRAGP